MDGEDGEDGHSNWQGSYSINNNPNYKRGDIVEWNGEMFALLDNDSKGIPGQSASWISLVGIPGVDGKDGDDTGLGIGWIILISIVAALLISTIFFLIYYFLFRGGGNGLRRVDLKSSSSKLMRNRDYYPLH